MIRVGVAGCGYWGPNLIRNFHAVDGCEVVALADHDRSRAERARTLCPPADLHEDGLELARRRDLDAVVIATPVSTHFELARAALASGKHVLVSKPMTRSVAEAAELVALAEQAGRVLMVDHTFVYSGAVRAIRQLVSEGYLGRIYCFDSVRVNLGLLQPDVSVLWDLGAHDFAIMQYVLRREPISVSAAGADPLGYRDGLESVVYVTTRFADGAIAHLNMSWLSPVKVRRTLICGSQRMIVYDHLDPDYQVKIYDRGVDVLSPDERRSALVEYRLGGMEAPKIDQTEALLVEASHFIDCCMGIATCETDGAAGLRVVRLLEAADRSLRSGGETLPLYETAGTVT